MQLHAHSQRYLTGACGGLPAVTCLAVPTRTASCWHEVDVLHLLARGQADLTLACWCLPAGSC